MQTLGPFEEIGGLLQYSRWEPDKCVYWDRVQAPPSTKPHQFNYK